MLQVLLFTLALLKLFYSYNDKIFITLLYICMLGDCAII